ncbi:hypothetical protein D3C85_1394580 [compost metagenome]
MIANNVVLFRCNLQAGVFIAYSLQDWQEYTWIFDVLCIGQYCKRQCGLLTAILLIAHVKSVL